jgi:hypothetical protein
MRVSDVVEPAFRRALLAQAIARLKASATRHSSGLAQKLCSVGKRMKSFSLRELYSREMPLHRKLENSLLQIKNVA